MCNGVEGLAYIGVDVQGHTGVFDISAMKQLVFAYAMDLELLIDPVSSIDGMLRGYTRWSRMGVASTSWRSARLAGDEGHGIGQMRATLTSDEPTKATGSAAMGGSTMLVGGFIPPARPSSSTKNTKGKT